MKIEIITERENPFMERIELMVKIDHVGTATPRKAEVQKVVSELKSVEPERVDVRKIFSKKGIGKSEAKIFIWKEPKVKDLSKEEVKEKKEETDKKTESKEEVDSEQAVKEDANKEQKEG